MSKRPLPSADRPTLERRRRGVLTFLREEWGLITLAIALTAMTWYITRLDVEKERGIPDVKLDLQVVQDDTVAIATRTVTLYLLSSESEYEEARQRMAAQNRTLTVHVDYRSGRLGPLDDIFCTADYPFRLSYLAPGKNSVADAGWVYRVRPQTSEIEVPQFTNGDAEGITMEAAIIGESSVTFKAPANVVGEAITPDPLNLEVLLRAAASADEKIVTLTFENWVNAPSTEGPPVTAFRRRLADTVLVDIKARVRFSKLETRAIRHVAVYEVQNAERFKIKIDQREDLGLTTAPPDTVELELRAPRQVLDQLEEKKGWHWGIVIHGELPTEVDKPERLSADFVFVPREARFMNPAIEYVPAPAARKFSVEVTLVRP